MMSYAYNPSICRLKLEHWHEFKTNLGCAARLYLKTKQNENNNNNNYITDGAKALLGGKAPT